VADWTEIPTIRDLTFITRSCEWPKHIWERFDAQFDYPDRPSEQFVIEVLCLVCGRTVIEAMAALPIVLIPNEYPELKKK
jgi:hypothetical protein